MSTSNKNLLVVFGATGIQGGSVINSVLEDPKAASTFRIRGITRDVTKPSAKALEARGVEVFAADQDDKESLRKALQGAYAVFSMTNFWDHMDAAREKRQGINVAEVANELGVKHFIYSSLVNVTKVSKGRYTAVKHFDAKGEIEDYIRTSIPSLPSTFFLPGFYMTNLSSASGPLAALAPSFSPSTNTYTFTLPIPPTIPGIPIFDAVNDTGKFVKAILLKREETLGKQVFGATKYISTQELAEGLARARGGAVKGEAKFVETEVWKEKLWEGVREELSQNIEMMGTTGYYGGDSLDWSLSILDEKPTTWEEFVASQDTWADLQK